MENRHKISSESLKSVLVSVQKETTNLKGGVFTLKSNSTNKDFTFRIITKPFKDKTYTHVYVETQYMNFKHLGTYFKGKIYKGGKSVESSSTKAIGFVMNKVEKGSFGWLDANVSVYHLGSCLKCGRALTDAKSIELGLGSVCQSK
tara:strand:- start:318 stop:755 length:438 start_codon:yes stop_codon:yes gene_type:complete